MTLYLQADIHTGRGLGVVRYMGGIVPPDVPGWLFLPVSDDCAMAPTEWRFDFGAQAVVHDPQQCDLATERMLAERRIDDDAARAIDHIRPIAAARLDAERLRQAELALASDPAYAPVFPLIGGDGPLHERAQAVVDAAKSADAQLVMIDVARRDAKRRVRAAQTAAEIRSVTLALPTAS